MAIIDPNYLKQFASAQNPMQFLTGDYTIGAGQQESVYAQIKEMSAFAQKQWQEAKDKLMSINPALDPQKYYLPPETIYDPGEGASSNRSAPVMSLQLQLQLQDYAIKSAEKAAQQYQQTGQLPQPPTPEQLFAQTGIDPSKITNTTLQQRITDFKQGKGLSPQDMASSNAAAARVGAPLPYPDAQIGQISPGGLFTNEQIQSAQAAGKSYDQIASQARQGTYQYQPSQGFGIGGVPQTNGISPDPNSPGSYLFQGKSYATKEAAEVAAQRAGVSTQQTSGQVGGQAGQPVTSHQGDIQSALDIINNSDLDAGQKMLFSQVVKDWDPNSEINVPNILTKFQEIRKTTIDPYFQEQSRVFIDQIQSAYTNLQQNRGLETQQEGIAADQNIRNAKADLEARGMTFSGEGIRQLGNQGAFAQPGQNPNNAIPVQQQLPGGGFAQGLVPQQNQIMASSSMLRYQKNLQDLQRSAEQTLGTEKSQGLIPGVTPLGNITQTAQLPNAKAQAEASTLSNLYSQAQQNYEQNKPIKPFNE